MGRSQWPRGLRHEMSSPACTLGLWVRIPLQAWMFDCFYSVFVLSCVSSGLATGWSLVQGVLPIVYKCKIAEPHKEEAKVQCGLQRHIERKKKWHMKVNALRITNAKLSSSSPVIYCQMEVLIKKSVVPNYTWNYIICTCIQKSNS
jgi:hypothetical protein